MPAYSSALSFNGGELSPYLARRLDFEKYPTGVERLENLLPMPFGGVRKRPGTLHLATLPAATRLEPFTFNSSNRYLLAFTTTSLRIYAPDGTLKDTIAATFADPFALQLENINDVVFIADPGAQPRRLSRVTDTDWTLEDIPWDFPPLLDQNLDEDHTLTIEPTTSTAWATSTAYALDAIVSNDGLFWRCHTDHTSGASTEPGTGADWPDRWALLHFDVGDSIDVSASASTFVADHVGGQWGFTWERTEPFYETILAINHSGGNGQTCDPIPIKGRFQVITGLTWSGVLTVQRSKDGKTWSTFREYTSRADRNVDVELETADFYFFRLSFDVINTAIGNAVARIVAIDYDLPGAFEIDAHTSGTAVTATVKSAFVPGTSYKWRPAAFDSHQGFPSSIAVHERRLVFAGTARQPVSLWLSKTDDLLDFETGTTDTDAIFVTLATTAQDPVRWLASQRRLMLGTSTSEWVVGSETTDAPLTPENFNAREYTHYGSAGLPAWRHNEGVFFVQRQARRFREIGYDITRETYDAADLTRLAEHITETGIVQIDFQAGREPYVWAVRADGTLLAFLYSRQERLAAWSRHSTTGGSFRSVAVLRNDSQDDDVFLVVERSGSFFLERFAADQQAAQEAGDADDPVHLDRAVSATTDGSGALSGLDHLDGQTVTFLADGIPGTAAVSSGELATGRPSVTATAGLPVTSTLRTLPLDSGIENGASLGRKKRASKVLADFYLTRGGVWTYDGGSAAIGFDLTSDAGDSTPPLFTGWKETVLPAGYVQDLRLEFTHADPWPCILRAISVFWEVSEP